MEWYYIVLIVLLSIIVLYVILDLVVSYFLVRILIDPYCVLFEIDIDLPPLFLPIITDIPLSFQ